MRGALFILLLMSMSETFSVPFLNLIKQLHKTSWAIKPGPWSRSWIFFKDQRSDIIHHKLTLSPASPALAVGLFTDPTGEPIYIYIYFFFFFFLGLHQVLLIAEECGDLPHPSCRLFVAVLRLLSSCGIWAPERTGPVAVVCGLSCPAAYGIPTPCSGLEPMSPGLEGRFSTTGPQGKSLTGRFWCSTQLYLPSFCRKRELLCMLSRKLSLLSHVAFC